ncbi:hypothetical protein Pcac1_g2046 [Phytophthora cactorum]|nr:hypothetical protein Pcac1_g2046 [Phytophthora cactorum]
MTLAAEYTHSATTYLRQLKTPVPDKDVRVPTPTLSLFARTDKAMAFMPMNINGSHWTCLLVDRTTRSIYCYHSPSALPQLTGGDCGRAREKESTAAVSDCISALPHPERRR